VLITFLLQTSHKCVLLSYVRQVFLDLLRQMQRQIAVWLSNPPGNNLAEFDIPRACLWEITAHCMWLVSSKLRPITCNHVDAQRKAMQGPWWSVFRPHPNLLSAKAPALCGHSQSYLNLHRDGLRAHWVQNPSYPEPHTYKEKV
jgi:hypothetical protein